MFLARMRIALVLLSGVQSARAFATAGCADAEFSCDGGRLCVTRRWLCDGFPDCKDGTDELPGNCAVHPSRNCSSSEHRCGEGKCVPAVWRCDGEADCGDQSDEANCASACPAHKFTCADRSCIASRWRCDGMRDCPDGSDELACDDSTAAGSTPIPAARHNVEYLFCDGGHRFPAAYRCDGDADCADGSDEANCTAAAAANHQACLPEVEFECSPSYCILSTWVCDGNADCADARDERNCPSCGEAQIRCGSGECVATVRRCDGAKDCVDGADEEGCDAPLLEEPSEPCNSSDHFRCGTGICIPLGQLCDGVDNCGNNEDEAARRCVDPCAEDNGGCSQRCSSGSRGALCSCEDGYRLLGRYSCEDVDECQTPGTCSQHCTNTAGGFHCSCAAGYIRDAENPNRCKASSGEVQLIYTHGTEVRSLRLRDRSLDSLVAGGTASLALDFHYERGQLVWSDIKERQLYRSSSLPGSAAPAATPQVVTRAAVADVAVDWLHDNLYFCDSDARSVALMDWDGRYRSTIASDAVLDPRAVAVAPMEGRLYWADWGRTAPRIERAGLDGKHRSVLVSSPHVVWPNGLAIDHASDRLFWLDARLHTLSSSRRDGSDVTVVLYSRHLLHIPYSVSVFEDRVFWVDWVTKALYSANKFTGANVTDLSSVLTPSMVKVYHAYRQPIGTNVCALRPCSHVCVRSVYGEAACVCPDGMSVRGRTCVGVPDATHVHTSTKSSQQQGHSTPPSRKIPLVPVDEDNTIEDGRMQYDEVSEDGGNGMIAKLKSGEDSSSTQASLILGILLGITVAGITCAAGFLAYTRRSSSVSPRMMRFRNPVYRKTTSEAADSAGGGFTVAQEELFYQPSAAFRLQTDRDDVPLTPEDE